MTNAARSRTALSLLVAGLWALPCAAASVELKLREREGLPVHDQRVVLHPPLAPGQSRWGPFGAQRFGVTGGDGKVVFDGVRPGSYTVSLTGTADPSLINPSDNPYAPAPVFTIAKEDERLALVLELWRGVPATAQLAVDRGDMPPAKVAFRSFDGLQVREFPLDLFGRWRGLLVPGRWEAQFEIPPGYLLSDLVSNGASLPGHVIRIDVTEDARPQAFSAFLNARSLITGKLVADDGSCPAQVVATLVEPADDWIAPAVARGGSEFRRVPAQFQRYCEYQLYLPEGAWSLRPQGDLIVGSEPEHADVTIALGETRTLNFALRRKEEEGGQPLIAQVFSPDRRPLAGAVVEVYRQEAETEDGEPVATAKTTLFPPAEFPGLRKGVYRVVAGHPDFLEADEIVPDHDPDASQPTQVLVVLREGARVHAHAADEKGASVHEVELSIERLGKAPPTRLASKEVQGSKMSRRVATDTTGHTEARGLLAGDYRISARMTGELAGTRFVRVRRGSEEPQDSLDATLSNGEALDLALAVLPAASLSGSLACTDRGTLPPEASFRVFDAAAHPDPWKDTELRVGAVLAANEVKLGGKALDRFRVGPLEPGMFVLAARPAGNEYWSWPPGLVMQEHTQWLDLQEKTTLDAGLVEIECGAVVMLVPRIASGEAAPDLHLGTLEVTGVASHDTDAYDDRLFVLKVPEGKPKMGVRFNHPYLIPSEVTLPSTVLDLRRGKLITLELPFAAIGGLLEVRGDGSAARLTSKDGSKVIRAAVDAKVAFPGTPAGSYRVELCADLECKETGKTWNEVSVVAGRTVSLP